MTVFTEQDKADLAAKYGTRDAELIISVNEEHEAQDGNSRLWGWFGLSRAAFCVLPRVLMHEMPDQWQKEMAILLEQFDDTWDDGLDGTVTVSYKTERRYAKFPEWVCNYRRPDLDYIDTLRKEDK